MLVRCPDEGNGFGLEHLALARVIHVLGVVLWIGGVAMVTTVLLPASRRMTAPGERLAWFERVEGRFAAQARITTLVTGLSGLYLLYALDAWHWFALASHWYLHAMVAVWALFTLMLFVLEPLVLHRWLRRRAERDPQGTFRIVTALHWVLLSASLLTIAGAVSGAHGWFWW